MHPILTFLSTLEQGPAQSYRGLSVVPLLGGPAPRLTYHPLASALASGRFTITEVSEGGSVPHLRAVNQGEDAVLLLDGEEIVGAKQNRVFNTTLLVPARSELLVPVSCTEAGRWAYDAPIFSDSDVIMPAAHRFAKSADVSASLERLGSYDSDQRAVWDRVENLHARLETSSRTHAMRDAYEARRADLASFLDAFVFLPGQKGLAVASGDAWLGVEVISRPEAYAQVHGKLVGSYAMDLLMRERRDAADAPETDLPRTNLSPFLERLEACNEARHPSPGLGTDHRYAGNGIVGSALVVEDEPVHVALFAGDASGEAPEPRMAGFLRRRDFRL